MFDHFFYLEGYSINIFYNNIKDSHMFQLAQSELNR